jgi:hypothetical protein
MAIAKLSIFIKVNIVIYMIFAIKFGVAEDILTIQNTVFIYTIIYI